MLHQSGGQRTSPSVHSTTKQINLSNAHSLSLGMNYERYCLQS